MQKFIAELADGGLDIVVLDKGLFETFVKQGVFSRLDNIDGLDITAVKEGLLEKILDRNNLNTAFKKVKSNKGAGGVDGWE